MDNEDFSQRLPQLEAALRGKALNLQKAAIDELATIPAELAVPLLGKILDSSDFMHRRMAVMGLGKHRTEESFQLLAGILAEEPDANVAGEAADAIFDFGPRAMPLLIEAFGPNVEGAPAARWLVRQTIIYLLLDTDCYDELLIVTKIALADDIQSVKELGIVALGHLLNSPFQAEALDLLTSFCTDPAWRNRWQATIALQHLQNSTTQSLIAQLQTDENFQVVAAALNVVKHWTN
jgi:HEAT repeat protein